ncbi:MAG: YdcH family protein [Pseudomonadota bacterium]
MTARLLDGARAQAHPPAAFPARENYQASLARQHRLLEQRIETERQRPAPCSITLQQLKRRRLTLKDALLRAGAFS